MHNSLKDIHSSTFFSANFKLRFELPPYPIDTKTECETQLWKIFNEVTGNCENAAILGEGYNMQRPPSNYQSKLGKLNQIVRPNVHSERP